MLLRRASDLRKALGVRRTQNLARGEQSQSRSFASSDGRDRPSQGHVCVDSVAIGSIWDRGAFYRQTLHEFPAIVVSLSRIHSLVLSLVRHRRLAASSRGRPRCPALLAWRRCVVTVNPRNLHPRSLHFHSLRVIPNNVRRTTYDVQAPLSRVEPDQTVNDRYKAIEDRCVSS